MAALNVVSTQKIAVGLQKTLDARSSDTYLMSGSLFVKGCHYVKQGEFETLSSEMQPSLRIEASFKKPGLCD